MSSTNTPISCDAEVLALVGAYRQPEMRQRYEELAAITTRECEGMLNSLHIKGVVTCRTKDPDSLEKKLKGMAKEPEFREWVWKNKDITQHDEMGDLAGVRIGLYLPGDVIKVGKEIQKRFEQKHLFGTVTGGRSASQGRNLDINNHEHGIWVSQDASGSNEYWEHSGYKSWQIVAGWKKPLERGLDKLSVEIQVGTVVTQAWAEIQHNIIYKQPADILATPTMKRMIDGINGLAITTEIMLRELEKSQEQARKEAEARDREKLSPAKEIEKWFHKTYLMKMPQEERERWVPHFGSALKFETLWDATRLPPKMGTHHQPILCPKNMRKLIELLGILRPRGGTEQLDVFDMLLEGVGYTPGEKTLGQHFLRIIERENLVTTESDSRFNYALFKMGSHLI
jgi:ppGpp synthetase/RelA/SpoT-type nucleotidyltranferase